MTAADLVALVLLLLIAAYACGGGADFGAGIWDLIAGGPDRGERPRALIDHAMAPVWEANNVWLVFILVVTWTGFPRLFEAVLSTAWLPLTLAALSIVMRGAAFAIRKHADPAGRHTLGVVFGTASLAAPFLFGAAIGGIASGRVPPGNAAGDRWASWLNPTSVLFGVLAALGAALIGAVFLSNDARRLGWSDMEGYFRRRAVAVTGALVLTALVGLLILHGDAPVVFDGLTQGWGLVLALVALAAIALTAVLLGRDMLRGTRLMVIGAVASLVLAWGFAQHPYLLPTTMTVAQGAGDSETLRWLVVVTIVAVLLVGPALALLYRLDLADRLTADEDIDLSAAGARPHR